MNHAFENARLSPRLHHPATFLERGVALPLTTPLLSGARARPGAEDQLELIILNPSGGRGVYILPWSSIGVFCHPTMHDCIFAEHIAGYSHVTPTIIRRVARKIAADGLAGESAAEAAALAAASEKADLVVANYKLLMLLFDQAGQDLAAFGEHVPSLAEDPAARLRMTVNLVSARIGRSSDWTAAALEDMADTMSGIGLGEDGAKARLQRQMDRLRHMVADIHSWTAARQEDSMTEYGALIGSVANLTLSMAETTLAAVRALTKNMEVLLQGWASNPDRIRELASRPEWLLDGWDTICSIWQHARGDHSQALALAEIVGLVPVTPKEAATWTGFDNQVLDREMLRHRRIVPFNQDWLTGESVFDLIARNEQLRAAAC